MKEEATKSLLNTQRKDASETPAHTAPDTGAGQRSTARTQVAAGFLGFCAADGLLAWCPRGSVSPPTAGMSLTHAHHSPGPATPEDTVIMSLPV